MNGREDFKVNLSVCPYASICNWFSMFLSVQTIYCNKWNLFCIHSLTYLSVLLMNFNITDLYQKTCQKLFIASILTAFNHLKT
jgi:hypothetical protein